MTTETADAKLRVIEGRKHFRTPALRYWIDDFITTKRWRWRPPTLKAYTSVLGLYAAHVGESHWPPARREVLGWLARLKETCSDSTVHSYWVHLRSFFNYLEKIEALKPSQNPARQILNLNVAPEKPDLPPAAFPPEDLDRLFGYLEARAQTGDRAAIRALALLRFAYVTGCREGEIARLTLDHLRLQNYEATILSETSKSKKRRTVYFDEDVRRALQDWLDVRPAAPSVRHVFTSLRGGRRGAGYPVKPRALYDVLQRQCDAAGVPRRKFHALRHSSVLDALDAGIDAAKVQAQLGHASIVTIMEYTRGEDEDRARSYRNRSLSAGLSERAERRREYDTGGQDG